MDIYSEYIKFCASENNIRLHLPIKRATNRHREIIRCSLSIHSLSMPHPFLTWFWVEQISENIWKHLCKAETVDFKYSNPEDIFALNERILLNEIIG